MDVWEMTPDEKADVENMCNALARAADAGANADARDHAVMAYVEDTTTTTSGTRGRHSFARERGESFANKSDPEAALSRARRRARRSRAGDRRRELPPRRGLEKR